MYFSVIFRVYVREICAWFSMIWSSMVFQKTSNFSIMVRVAI